MPKFGLLAQCESALGTPRSIGMPARATDGAAASLAAHCASRARVCSPMKGLICFLLFCGDGSTDWAPATMR